jgi:hypothetical protein
LGRLAGASVAGVVVTATAVVGAGIAKASTANGYDVSWPQCGKALPVDGDFRIVGVSGGKPYEDNPCLAAQYQWAVASPDVGFYMNTANPGNGSNVVNWYGQRSPNPNCSRSDEGACAYDYGYNAAKHAFAYAQQATGAAGAHSWWLDVETANSWSSTPALNTADILGAVAFLRSQGVPVGAYSTGYQWGIITGGAHASDLYVWYAGAGNAGQAALWCAATDSSFTGGTVVLVQWVQDGIDRDHACAPLPVAAAPPPPSPAGLDQIVADLLTLNLPKLLTDLQPH